MKTDFAILWVDDNAPFVHSSQVPLEKWMDTHGFTLSVIHHKSETGILDDLKTGQIELIVIDYKLPKKKGDEVIADIRSQNYFQDVIFYSQGGTADVKFETPPDGVFFVERGDAVDRIKNLIDLKIKRASDLATLRGWIVADSIELEFLLGGVLAKCFQSHEEMFVNRILEHEGLFDFGKKHAVLSGILKDTIASMNLSSATSPKLTRLRECKRILDMFMDEIIHTRNALAHQRAEVENGSDPKIKTRSKEKQLVINQSKCGEIRKNIRKHRDNLTALQKLMCE